MELNLNQKKQWVTMEDYFVDGQDRIVRVGGVISNIRPKGGIPGPGLIIEWIDTNDGSFYMREEAVVVSEEDAKLMIDSYFSEARRDTFHELLSKVLADIPE